MTTLSRTRVKRELIVEDGVIAGNVQDKYGTRNPLYRILMSKFLGTLGRLIERTRGEVESILEVGCGEGDLAARIAALRVAPVRACDFSRKVIELAARSHAGSGVDFYPRDIYQLGEEDGADLVVCCEVLEHLTDPERGLRKLAETSRGYVLVSVPHEPIWRVLNVLRLTYLRDLGNTPGHLNHWTARSFRRFISHELEVLELATPFPWLMALCRRRAEAP